MEDVVNYLRDVTNSKKWETNIKDVTLIEQLGPKSQVIYIKQKKLLVTQKKDLCCFRGEECMTDGSYVWSMCSVDHNKVPPSNKLAGGLLDFAGTWVKSIGQGVVEYTSVSKLNKTSQESSSDGMVARLGTRMENLKKLLEK